MTLCLLSILNAQVNVRSRASYRSRIFGLCTALPERVVCVTSGATSLGCSAGLLVTLSVVTGIMV